MPRKSDPIFGVIDFFEKQPLAVAESTLSLCRRTVQKRQADEQPPAPVKAKRAPRKQKTTSPRPSIAEVLRDAGGQIVTGSQEVASPTPQPPVTSEPVRQTRRRTAPLQTPATSKRLEDVALPGLGPSTVGD